MVVVCIYVCCWSSVQVVESRSQMNGDLVRLSREQQEGNQQQLVHLQQSHDAAKEALNLRIESLEKVCY